MATWYISPSGSDSTGNGSSGNPWLTLAQANSQASSGDTVMCAAGTYSLSAQISITKSLNIIGSGTTGTAGAIFDWGGNTRATCISVSTGTLAFSNMRFRNAAGVTGGFSIGGAGAAMTFSNCKFDAFVLSAGDVGNALFKSRSAGGTLSLTACEIYGITRSSAADASFCDQYSAGSSMTFLNCVIYSSAALGSQVPYLISYNGNGTGSTFTVKNSIFVATSGTNVTFRYNTSLGTWTATACCFYGFQSYSGTGVITSDPLFVDAANANFNLRNSPGVAVSPCIGAGVLP